VKWLILIFICLSFIQPAWAEKVLSYRTYNQKTGETVNHFTITIGDVIKDTRKVSWEKIEGKDVTLEEYLLDAHYATQKWKVLRPKNDTNYTGERRGDTLFLQGQLNGKRLNKYIKIDHRPFYYNPKLGLMNFVLSKKKSSKFWAMRNDDCTEYLMEAKNKGPDLIQIAGQNIEVIRVHWTLPDFRSAFFKRVYWFRASDGMYIRQETSKNQIRELIHEQSKP